MSVPSAELRTPSTFYNTPMSFDLTVIGAGAIGTALAREVALRDPSLRVALIEQEERPAMHQSGRNSGVAHAGFNPPPGTLKARLCVEGNRLLREYCHERSVPFEDVGTLVVASNPDEELRLRALRERGEQSGVPGLELLTLDAARTLEPNLAEGISLAMHAPTGAILDARAYVEALAADARASGVAFHFQSAVRSVEKHDGSFLIEAGNHRIETQRVINASGAWVDRVARLFGWDGPYEIVPFRGRYWRLDGKDDLIRSMIYPVPHPKFPFLGVHITKKIDGSVVLGPNAMLALGRDAYSFWNVNWNDVTAMVRARPFRKLMSRGETWQLAADEIARSLSPGRVAKEASHLVSGIEARDLAEGPPAGIRAQLVDREGNLVDDFLLEVVDGSVHVLNAVSPGLTSSLAFARYLCDDLGSRGFLTGSAFHPTARVSESTTPG